MNDIEIYKTADANIEVQVSLKDEMVWLNRHQMELLFERDIKTIGKHINTVLGDGKLEENSVVAKFATTTQHGAIRDKSQTKNVAYYNLDVIISVGYRVNFIRGTQFRQWNTQRFKDLNRSE